MAVSSTLPGPPSSPDRYVFSFAAARGLGAEILGGKGAGLTRLTALGMPVPPGFTVTCQAARAFRLSGILPSLAVREIADHLSELEIQMTRRLGATDAPLLVSVRSGAPVSMPGMMDTVLNVGLNADTVFALSKETGDERFAWACYERFAESYARIVRGIGAADIEDHLMDLDADAGPRDTTLALLDLIERLDGRPIPDDPREQISEAVVAVFRSWDSPRAKSYRAFRGIDDDLCTAATVQAMVFGNRGDNSASGVAFTRDPSSGETVLFGDVLFNAQGEDVVSGDHDAEPLASLSVRMPDVAEQLEADLAAIEREAGDLCEVEFTIEEGTLYILQTRVGQRSGRAAVRVAVDLVDEGVVSVETALSRVSPAQLEAAARPGFAGIGEREDVVAVGLAASPGAASGKVAFDASRAVEMAGGGIDVILVRPTTSPNDVAGFIAAQAIVTGRGGRTSHAAVVARGMHRPAVCGIGEIKVSGDRRTAEVTGVHLVEGDEVSVDGDRGLLLRGTRQLAPNAEDRLISRFVSWCEDRARVPLLADDDIAGLPVVDDLAAFSAAFGTVLLDLQDPRTVSAPDLAAALRSHQGRAPVLRFSQEWLRQADAPIQGHAVGILAPRNCPSAPLLRAVLTHR